MNYLAHAYLSFGNKGLLAGNMISDFVKGNAVKQYSGDVYNGIRLHRFIDSFTDEHMATKKMKNYFKKFYGHYAAIFPDLVYDHFLANDTNCFTTDSYLMDFTLNTYETLNNYYTSLPEYFQRIFPYMKEQNWLYNYRFQWGFEKSLSGLVKRAKYLENHIDALDTFITHKEDMHNLYLTFIPEVKAAAYGFIKKQFPDSFIFEI